MGYQVATSGAAERQGVVQRLDVGTTGVMAVAKSERAYSMLKRAFKTRAVDKRYAALAQGHPDPTSGTIDAPIGRHPRRTTSSRSSRTVARASPTTPPRKRSAAATLLDIHLETGRTHQIRVHLAAIRHPCVGDLTYGADPVLAARLGLPGSGCTRASWASRTRSRESGRSSVRPTHRTCNTRSICCERTAEARNG